MEKVGNNQKALLKIMITFLIISLLLGGCGSDGNVESKETNVNEEKNNKIDDNEQPSKKYELWEIIKEEPDREVLDAMDQDYVVVYAEFEDGKPNMDNLVHQYHKNISIGDELVIGENTLNCIGYKICPCRYRKYEDNFIKEILYSEEYDVADDRDWTVVEPMYRNQENLEKAELNNDD